MKYIFLAALLILSLLGCKNNSNSSKNVVDFVPESSAIIIKANNLETFKSDIQNNHFLKELSNTSIFNELENNFKTFDSLTIENEILFCISENNDYSLITKFTKELANRNNNSEIFKNYYQKVTDSILVVSTSEEIIKNLSEEKTNKNFHFKKLYNTSNKNKLTLFINAKNTQEISDSIFKDSAYNLSKVSNWISVDASIEQNQINLNGITTVNDSLPKLLNVFKNTYSQQNKTAEVTPKNADGFLSFTFNDFKVFNDNLIKEKFINAIDSIDLQKFNSITEIGIIHKEKNTALALFTSDIIETEDAFVDKESLSKTYRNTPIYNIENDTILKVVLKPFLDEKMTKITILNDALIFSNNEEFLIEIITNFQNKTTLNDTDSYKENLSFLSDESSLLIVANTSNFKSVLKEKITDKYRKEIEKPDLKDYKNIALQFINDDQFLHVNAIIKKTKPKAYKNTITQEYSVTLDTDLLIAPQIVKNHKTNQKEIVAQDINNILYLISNRGKVLWKKQLNGPVIGIIEQIDIYKNGRLQLAFTTPKRVYVLDRNGKDVSPFPLKFNDEITQPLSVFDYDKKKNYRLLVTQGKQTLMYDTKGKIVKGFTFKKAKSDIKTQPKHFRIGTKDYIVFASGNKLNILDRTGKTRINIKSNFNFSDNSIYLNNNKFTFTNTAGELIQIDSKGRINKQNLELASKHKIDATSKTFVSLFENQLTIKGRKKELSFGNYTAPKIFYLNDKIYVSVTDLQTQKAYLFDSQAKSIQNFPIYGNSSIELDNIDKDQNLEFIAKGDNNNILIYQLN